MSDDYKETPTKECPYCFKAKGWKRTGIAILMAGGFKYIPVYRKCKWCDGTGEVYMTIDEINFEDECRRDDERDFMNDR